MATIPFIKYHGAGNDFILIDDRSGNWLERIKQDWVAGICHRRFGIGADGMILLQQGHDGADFSMKYYNSDGNISTFCGNGGRCIVSFAARLGIHNGQCKFVGTDGWHEASLNKDGLVRLSMSDVFRIEKLDDNTYSLFTGSPHYVTFVENSELIDVQREGRTIRYSPPFEKEGINVNFVQSFSSSEIRIRTYERGVEDETMACGTGVVAAAIANAIHHNDFSGKCFVQAMGGTLRVEFTRIDSQKFNNVRLIGPAVEVFEGVIELG